MSKQHKKICTTLNNIEHFLILASSFYYWMRFHFCFCFFSLAIPTGIKSCTMRLNICAMTAGINIYKLIIKKKKNKHE